MLRRGQIDELRTAVGADGLITGKSQLQTYECDALTNFRVMPDAVVLPRTAGQAQAVVRLCARDRIPFVSRGAGTGLSGGALPAAGGIVISLARMNRILEVDFANRQVVVEPGVINAHVTQRVAARGYFYAPDPSSQSVCTIGGNVAENAAARIASNTVSRPPTFWHSMWCRPQANWSCEHCRGGGEGGNGYWRIRAASRMAEDGTVVADRRIFDSRGPHGKVAASRAGWNHIRP
jgi:hypothetical protein